MQKKFFTLDEANDFIPHLEYKISKIVRVKNDLAAYATTLVKQGIPVQELIDQTITLTPDLEPIQIKLSKYTQTIKDLIGEINTMGCIVKDVDLGLVDFYGILDGREVFWCWQMGERQISYYHLTSEGFGNRKPLSLLDEDDDSPARFYH